MAWTSKFSFPSFGRAPKSDKKSTPNLQQDIQNSTSVPSSMSKAERLLGPTETISGNSPRVKTCADSTGRTRLTKYPSSLSIAGSEMRAATTAQRWHVESARSTRPSSPVRPPIDYNGAIPIISVPNNFAGSSVTSQSYYDASTSPLSISQQTSASSARDMALRKGCPPVGSVSRDNLSRSLSPVSRKKEKLASPRDPKNTKPRPSYIDLSMVPPKPKSLRQYLHSPKWVSENPSKTSLTADSNPVRTNTQRRWLRQKNDQSTVNNANIILTPPYRSRAASLIHEQELSAPKMDRTTPTKVVQNWLDEAEREDSLRASSRQSATKNQPQKTEASISGESPSSSSESVRTLHSQLSGDISRTVPVPDRQSLHPSTSRDDDRSISHKSRKSTISKFVCSDLHTQSVLSLSSSEDESETDSKRTSSTKQRSARNSIGRRTVPPEARATRAGRSGSGSSNHARKVRDGGTMRDTTLHPRAETNSRSDQTVPISSGRSSRQQVQSVRWQIDGSQGTIEVGTAIPSRRTVPNVEPIRIEVRGRDPRMSRVMAVTKEEEKLLEAMREKRASMRKTNLVEGYNIAMEHSLVPSPPRRPKTAEDHKRRSSSFFEADMSCFPAPPESNAIPAVRKTPPGISIDDLHLHLDSRHSQRASESNSRNSYMALSTPSSKLSFGASDLMPSPTTTQGVPSTPPSDEPVPEPYKSGLASSTGTFYDERKSGHSRNRTYSSGLIIFDGTQEGTGGQEEVDQLAQWAIGTCL